MFRFLGTLAFLFMALCSAAPAQDVLRGPEPAWVDMAALPQAASDVVAASEDGVVYLLSDTQAVWANDEMDYYHRLATQISGHAGLDVAAPVSVDFDPQFDSVTLHHITVLRDGAKIEWADRVKEDVFRRESRLEEGIIDGTLTAYLQIPDLRLGDVVDVSWTVHSRPVVPGALGALSVPLEYGVPVQITRAIVHWPAEWTLNQGALPDRVIHSSRPGWQGATLHEWRRDGHVPPRSEDLVPYESTPEAVLRLSPWANWQPLSAALSPYYTADYPLSADWEARLDTLRAAHPNPADQAIAALRMVQDDIRYVSLSVGAGGIFARPPAEVIRSGFGDCKDKALLLRVLLARLGIAADVALTNIDTGYGLPADVPSLWAFDHAIVAVHLDNQTYWVDPTAAYEGGTFATAAPPDYGFALPLANAAQAALQAIPVSPETLWQIDTTESYLFTPFGLYLSVDSTYLRGAANWMRTRFETETPQSISDEYQTYYATDLPGLTLFKPITYEDDRAANRVTVKEQYLLGKSALADPDFMAEFPFHAEDYTANLPDPQVLGTRQLPMYTGPARVVNHKIVVLNAPVNFEPPKAETIRNDAFSLTMSATAPVDGSMILNWTFRREGAVLPAEKVAGVLQDARHVSDLTSWSWNLVP